ncbi:MAG: ATP-binding protein [Candidatus Methanomethylophilaceae archaeon]|nr:ATP-binding protein [Candidatus Methanomethylophilaceae archaeon]
MGTGIEMLVDFAFENYGPFREKTVFSMLRDSDIDASDNLLKCGALQDMVLNSCAIIGPNSSGKSNVVKALSAL